MLVGVILVLEAVLRLVSDIGAQGLFFELIGTVGALGVALELVRAIRALGEIVMK